MFGRPSYWERRQPSRQEWKEAASDCAAGICTLVLCGMLVFLIYVFGPEIAP